MENQRRRKILFVCNQNKVRSLTAEHLYRVRPDLEVRSAGTASFAKTPLTEDMLEWAEEIFVFDSEQTKTISSRFADAVKEKRVVCLGLPDKFQYKAADLVIKLTVKLDPFIGRPNVVPKAAKSAEPAKRTESISPSSEGEKKSLAKQLLAAVGLTARNRKPAVRLSS